MIYSYFIFITNNTIFIKLYFNNIMDALVFSQIENKLDDLNKTTVNPNITKDGLNNILNKTTIKRACCINKNRVGTTGDSYTVSVRIPTPANFDYNKQGNSAISAVWKKFNYIDKPVSVPASMCDSVPGYDYTTDKCRDFMSLYCNNVKSFYITELAQAGGSYSDDEFVKYKPECACFIDQPSYITGSAPAVCFAPGCDANRNDVFIDQASRQGCSLTICNSVINIDNIKAGRDANINTKIEQNCGNTIGKNKTTTGTGTTNATTGGVSGGSGSTSSNVFNTPPAPTLPPPIQTPTPQLPSVSPSKVFPSEEKSKKNTSETSNVLGENIDDVKLKIQSYFSSDNYYIGFIIIGILVIIICCCSMLIIRKKK